jgi:hypothetical protein
MHTQRDTERGGGDERLEHSHNTHHTATHTHKHDTDTIERDTRKHNTHTIESHTPGRGGDVGGGVGHIGGGGKGLRGGDADGAERAERAGCGAIGRGRGQTRASLEELLVDDHLQGSEVQIAVALSLAAGRLCVCVWWW